MKKYEIYYALIPTAYNRPAKAVVEAENEDDARRLLRRALNDDGVYHNYGILDIYEWQPPQEIKGRVISFNN